MKLNKIPEQYVGTVYYHDTVIGRFTNVMEILDFRIQVGKARATGYYYIIDNYPNKIIIDELGGVYNHPELSDTPYKYTSMLYAISKEINY